jgi:hypothetical protein
MNDPKAEWNLPETIRRLDRAADVARYELRHKDFLNVVRRVQILGCVVRAWECPSILPEGAIVTAQCLRQIGVVEFHIAARAPRLSPQAAARISDRRLGSD